MYKIEYNLIDGAVIEIAPFDGDAAVLLPNEYTTETLELKETEIAIYNGEVPADKDGYSKQLFYGIKNRENGISTRNIQTPTLYAIYTEVEGWFEIANAKDVADLKLQSDGVHGLGFKSKDNTVNLTTPAINLGVNDFTIELWARTEGCGSQTAWSLITGGKQWFAIYGSSNNDLYSIRFPDTVSPKILSIGKVDATKNLHHIVITRQGALITAIINGRLIKSVTQDKVIDFSEFVFDVANTSYFSLGRIFNYAIDTNEAIGLWNNGKVSDVALGSNYYKYNIQDEKNYFWSIGDPNAAQASGNKNVITITKKLNYIAYNKRADVFDLLKIGNKYTTSYKIENNTDHTIKVDDYHVFKQITLIPPRETVIVKYTKEATREIVHLSFSINGSSESDFGGSVIISEMKIETTNCLLELLPSSIHSKGVYNTGVLGSSHDAVLSKPEETIFIKDKQYKDYQTETIDPDFHPIAIGQKYLNTSTDTMFESILPPTNREWNNSDWIPILSRENNITKLHLDFKLQNKGVYGLGFKSGDNTVNLEVPIINLGLNDFTVEVWAKMEGCGGSSHTYTLTNARKKWYVDGSLKIYNLNSSGTYPNGIESIAFYPTSKNNISVSKLDNTKNLHHIVITRQGAIVTAIINGRYIITKEQDSVLDFSEFVFDIANTTYFSLGRVFNYCMSNDEAINLWNGGRVDEVVLNNDMFYVFDKPCGFTHNPTVAGGEVIEYSANNNSFNLKIKSVGTLGNSPRGFFIENVAGDRSEYIMEFDYVVKSGTCILNSLCSTVFNQELVGTGHFKSVFNNDGQGNLNMRWDGRNLFDISVTNARVYKKNCLLELLPSSIHSKGVYNTGALGESYNAVLSKPDQTVFIKEKQYKEKQTTTAAPDFHPIAMGQECYNIATGDIYKASVPPTTREWAVADWKQINNA